MSNIYPDKLPRYKIWRNNNKERQRKNDNKWYQKNKIKRRQQAKRYYIKNQEKERERGKQYRLKHPEKLKATRQRHKEKYPWKARDYHLRKRFGITLDQYNTILETQNFSCAVCQSFNPQSKVGWHTDHNHKTGQLRGLLCLTIVISV